MDNKNDENDHINAHEESIREDDEKEQLFEDINENKITEAELENIHLNINQNLPLLTMNSTLMNVHHNYPENFIDDPEEFCCEYKESKIQTSTTQVINSQLDVGSNYRMLTEITMLTYIRPLKCNVQILNGRRSPAKVFGTVIVTLQKQASLCNSGHHTICHKNSQNKISQTSLKNYNPF